jgi:hypothetical protein
MIRIAVAAIIATFITYDAAVVPAATGIIETIDRPRGAKGDRLPVHPQGTGCADAVWPHYQGECVNVRQQPGDHMPATRFVRTVAIERTPAAGAASALAN